MRTSLALVASLALGSCFLDFEAFDPRETTAGSGADGAGGGGTTATGGSAATSTSATGAGAAGGSGGEGGDQATRCGTPELLADDFDDATPSDLWWTYAGPGSSVGESAGTAVITLAQQTEAWAGFTSRHYFDLRDARFFLELPEVPNPATSAMGSVVVIFEAGSYFQIVVKAGLLSVTRTLGGAWAELVKVDYDPVAHRWWQIREEDGTLHFETSPDGARFTTLTAAPTSSFFPLDLVRLELSAYTDGSETSPGAVRFDNVMGGGPPEHGWCPPGIVSDDFDDGIRARAWKGAYDAGSGTASEAQGQLLITAGPSSGDAAYVSAQPFDFTGHAALVEVPSIGAHAQSYAFFRLDHNWDDGVEIGVSDGQIRCRKESGGTMQTVYSGPYDLIAHRWWRIREDAGTVYCETAPDGSTWTTLGFMPGLSEMNALSVLLGAGVSGNVGTSLVTAFDNYNLPP